MVIEPAHCMRVRRKIKIKIAQQPYIMRTYKLRYHVKGFVEDEVAERKHLESKNVNYES